MERGCDPTILTEPGRPLPTFLHYCQRYEIEELKREAEMAAAAAAGGDGGGGGGGAPPPSDARAPWLFSKYQVPDEILHCPAGSETAAGGAVAPSAGQRPSKRMKLTDAGFLPEPPLGLTATTQKQLRSIFGHCVATRATNQAARDYRKWFCSAAH